MKLLELDGKLTPAQKSVLRSVKAEIACANQILTHGKNHKICVQMQNSLGFGNVSGVDPTQYLRDVAMSLVDMATSLYANESEIVFDEGDLLSLRVAKGDFQNVALAVAHGMLAATRGLNDESRLIVEAAVLEAIRSDHSPRKAFADAISEIQKSGASLSLDLTPPPGFTDTPIEYYAGVASVVGTRIRALAQVEKHSDKESDYELVAVNPLDERTCKICAFIAGSRFTIGYLRKQRDDLLSARTREDLVTATPWVSEKLLADLQREDRTPAEVITALKIGLPPYHFRCRCTIGRK